MSENMLFSLTFKSHANTSSSSSASRSSSFIRRSVIPTSVSFVDDNENKNCV